ncbi:MAG: hypothetical protein V4793_02470 [Paraburkholderia tropica]
MERAERLFVDERLHVHDGATTHRKSPAAVGGLRRLGHVDRFDMAINSPDEQWFQS